MNPVRVRFAPSPTGFLHIGSLRTALFNWLWAKKNNGAFILRIEDTDQGRFVKGSVENILEALQWYGLTIDEGPIFQSQRLKKYSESIDALLKQGSAYYCFCSPERLESVRKIQQANKQSTKYDGLCRSLAPEEVQKRIHAGMPYVIRLKVPSEGITEFTDRIYGRVCVENAHIDDQVLMKSDGFPTYHLANVVDDHEMKISHVIRAEEWLPSTPKHILLYKAFGWVPPEFAHLPMVLGTDRSKLSKRHGAMAALEYRELGYLPEAVLNFIALLGWNPKTEREMFSLEELVQEFDLSKVNKASAIFNKGKLDWLNGQYIRKEYEEGPEALAKKVDEFFRGKYPKDQIAKITPMSAVRAVVLSDFGEEISMVYGSHTYEPRILVPKGGDTRQTVIILEQVAQILEVLDDTAFTENKLKEIFTNFIAEHQYTNKLVLWPLRVAVTGKEKSPGVFEVMAAQGKQRACANVKRAIEYLKKI
ncbi:MAG: glutamate--tRNA ligase [Patescibacteria group bacterium]|nr:glutamate--tRNA ligase [Patescibacteria group bacterium]